MAEDKKSLIRAGKFGDVENALASIVIDHEYPAGAKNMEAEIAEYESLVEKVDGNRPDKNYQWQSDITLGYFIAHMLTDASNWAMQYFSSRDFCNVYLEGLEPDDKAKARAVKVLINKSLNMSAVYHFQKYIRARLINWLFGQVYILCYWEKKYRNRKIKQDPKITSKPSLNESGSVVWNDIEEPQKDKEIRELVYDRFNYEVIDPRCVFTAPGYAYSVQQKPWVIILKETTLQDLQERAEQFGYFNLDRVEDALKGVAETEVARKTTNKDGDKAHPERTPLKNIDLFQRFGKMWAVVKETDEDGVPTVADPGIDANGNKIQGAEMVECIISFVKVNGISILVRFSPTDYINSRGEAYKPIVRGICYIHPTKDTGLSDGRNLREIDTAIDDTFNVSNDRTMLATMPVMKIRKSAIEDNPTVFIKPDHLIELEDPESDLKEMKIEDNIQGAMSQLSVLKSTGSELDSIWPTTQGGPMQGDNTATEIAATESRTNARGGFKSLTWEYTMLAEFYQQIIQQTYRFCDPNTAIRLMSDLATIFDPDGDYTYVPLSQALEAEHSKRQKASALDQMMGRVVGMVQIFPKETALIVAKILEIQFLELGAEFRDISEILTKLTNAKPVVEGKGAEQTANASPEMTQNQSGLPVSEGEQDAREGAQA